MTDKSHAPVAYISSTIVALGRRVLTFVSASLCFCLWFYNVNNQQVYIYLVQHKP